MTADQFGLHRLPNGSLVVVVQSDMIPTGNSVVVAPVVPARSLEPALKGLNPTIWFAEAEYRLAIQGPAAIQTRQLGPKVGDLKPMRDDIIREIDFLFTGV